MAMKQETDLDDREAIHDRIQSMVPDVILAVESLELATSDRVRTCLEKCNIKATRSETEMALEYGCKIGVVEEKRRYRLNPDLRSALLKGPIQPKKIVEINTENIKKEKQDYYDNDDDCDCSSCMEEAENNEDGRVASSKRVKRQREKEPSHDDYDDLDDPDVEYDICESSDS